MLTEKHFIIMLLIALTTVSCQSQNFEQDNLIGYWNNYFHKGYLSSSGTEIPENGGMNLNFLENGKVVDSTANKTFSYSLEDSILTIGIEKLVVIKLTKEEMVLKRTHTVAGVLLGESYFHYRKME